MSERLAKKMVKSRHRRQPSLTQWSRHHEFNYPQYGRKIRRLSNRFGKASRAEDSAFAVYRAMKARGPRRRKLIKRARKGTF